MHTGLENWLPKEALLRFANEFDAQPFHLSDKSAKGTVFFGGLACTGWHTAAMTMRLLVGAIPLADGIIGASGEISWSHPT